MIRTSIWIGLFPPTRVIVWCGRTCNNFVCILRDNSPISSKNTVPWFAVSSRPIFLLFPAPVNALLSWPNSSLSNRDSVIAPQLIVTKLCSARRLFWWIKRAVSSLPAPVSPKMRAVESTLATRSAFDRTLSMASSSTIICRWIGSCAFNASNSDRYRVLSILTSSNSDCRLLISSKSRSLQMKYSISPFSSIIGVQETWAERPVR